MYPEIINTRYCFGLQVFLLLPRRFSRVSTPLGILLKAAATAVSPSSAPCIIPGTYVHALAFIFIAHRGDNSYARRGLFMFANLTSRACGDINGRCRRGSGERGVTFHRLDYSTPRSIPTRRHQYNRGQEPEQHDSCSCRELVCGS